MTQHSIFISKDDSVLYVPLAMYIQYSASERILKISSDVLLFHYAD